MFRGLELHWTVHAKAKMMQYRLSPARVRRVLHSPRRVEEGVAPKTVAMMQPASIRETGIGKEKETSWSQEIWVMVEDKGKTRNVVSAWRYPGMTKTRADISASFFKKEYQAYLKTQ